MSQDSSTPTETALNGTAMSDLNTPTERGLHDTVESNSVLSSLMSFFDGCHPGQLLLPGMMEVAAAAKGSCTFLLAASQPYRTAVQALEQQVPACWLLLEQSTRLGLLACILKADELRASYLRFTTHLSSVTTLHGNSLDAEEVAAHQHLQALHVACLQVVQQLTGQSMEDLGRMVEAVVLCPTPSLSDMTNLHTRLQAWLLHTRKPDCQDPLPTLQDLTNALQRLRAVSLDPPSSSNANPVRSPSAPNFNTADGTSCVNPFSVARDMARLTAHMSLVDPLAGLLSVGPATEDLQSRPTSTQNGRVRSAASQFRRGESERLAVDRLPTHGPTRPLHRLGSHGPSHRRGESDGPWRGESERALVRNSSVPATVGHRRAHSNSSRLEPAAAPSRLGAVRTSSRLSHSQGVNSTASFSRAISSTRSAANQDGTNSSLTPPASTYTTPPSSPFNRHTFISGPADAPQDTTRSSLALSPRSRYSTPPASPLKSSAPSSKPPAPPQPPDEYLCPISWTLMENPVVIESGQTYERRVIENWFLVGRKTCPMTGQKLNSTAMTPNWILKRLIAAWKEQHGIVDPPKTTEKATGNAEEEEVNEHVAGSRDRNGAHSASTQHGEGSLSAPVVSESPESGTGDIGANSTQQPPAGSVNNTTSSTAAPAVEQEEDINESLLAAAEAGQVEAVRRLLEVGANPNRQGGSLRQPALQYGIMADSEEMVTLLVQHGALANTRNQQGPTPVMSAVLLRKNNALRGLLTTNVNLHTQCDDHGTPLHAAIVDGNETAVRLLVERGAPLDTTADSDSSDTPLSLACRLGQADTVRLLLEHGAPIDPPIDFFYYGCNAMYAAVEGGWLDIVRLLLDAGAVGECRKAYEDSRSVLHVAAMEGSVPMMELLLGFDHIANWIDRVDEIRIEGHQNDFYGHCTPLHAAAGVGALPVVKLLLERGAQVDAGKDKHQATPLMVACLLGYLEVVECLLDAGADVNYRDEEGVGPIHQALQSSNERLLTLLISRGAYVAATRPVTSGGEGPAGTADTEQRVDGERAEAEEREHAEGGADVAAGQAERAVDGQRQGSGEWAESTGVREREESPEGDGERLRQGRGDRSGEDVRESTGSGERESAGSGATSASQVNRAVTDGSIISPPSSPSHPSGVNSEPNAELVIAESAAAAPQSLRNVPVVSALVSAVTQGSVAMLKVLLEAGAPVDEVDEDTGFTALLQACSQDQDPEYGYAQHTACAELLLKHGADVNAHPTTHDSKDVPNSVSPTPLSVALMAGNVGLVPLLLAAGAKAEITMLHELVRESESHDLGDRLQLMLQTGLDVNARDPKGRTLLHIAARCCSRNNVTHVLQVLLKCGAVIDAKDDLHATALDYAVLNKEVEGVRALLQAGALPHGEEAHTTLAFACQEEVEYEEVDVGQWNSVQLLRECEQAANANSMIEEQSADGVDGYLRQYNSRSPLYYNTDYQQSSAAVQILHMLLDRDESLLDRPLNSHGMTPLHIAAACFNVMLTRALLQRGANANAVDAQGNTPLHVAATKKMVCKTALQLLLAAGSDPNRVNDDGLTARDALKATVGWGTSSDVVAILEEVTTVPSKLKDDAPYLSEEDADLFVSPTRRRFFKQYPALTAAPCMLPPSAWVGSGVLGNEAGAKLEASKRKEMKKNMRKCGLWCHWLFHKGTPQQVGHSQERKLSAREVLRLADKVISAYIEAKSALVQLGRMNPVEWDDDGEQDEEGSGSEASSRERES